jgi:large subunit ribosomal protein L18
MSKKLIHKRLNESLRKARVRSTISGTETRPRLSVFISNQHITAQIVNDDEGKTLAYLSTVGHKDAKGTMTEKAEWVGNEIAVKAKQLKINTVVFDRGSKIYHGRVAALAEAARKAGLEF